MHEEWVTVAPCDSGACVEVSFTNGGVRLRSSLRPKVTVRLEWAEWDAFVASVRRGLLADR